MSAKISDSRQQVVFGPSLSIVVLKVGLRCGQRMRPEAYAVRDEMQSLVKYAGANEKTMLFTTSSSRVTASLTMFSFKVKRGGQEGRP
jgi:hypothetical protein